MSMGEKGRCPTCGERLLPTKMCAETINGHVTVYAHADVEQTKCKVKTLVEYEGE